MIVPSWLFTLGLWLAIGGAGAGATYLLVVLAKDWRNKSLW